MGESRPRGVGCPGVFALAEDRPAAAYLPVSPIPSPRSDPALKRSLHLFSPTTCLLFLDKPREREKAFAWKAHRIEGGLPMGAEESC